MTVNNDDITFVCFHNTATTTMIPVAVRMITTESPAATPVTADDDDDAPLPIKKSTCFDARMIY